MNIEHRIVAGIGMSQDEAIRQHFGKDGPPENGRIVVRKYAAIGSKPPRRVKVESQQPKERKED